MLNKSRFVFTLVFFFLSFNLYAFGRTEINGRGYLFDSLALLLFEGNVEALMDYFVQADAVEGSRLRFMTNMFLEDASPALQPNAVIFYGEGLRTIWTGAPTEISSIPRHGEWEMVIAVGFIENNVFYITRFLTVEEYNGLNFEIFIDDW